MSSETRLLYFADPMCSWCWGFSPVLDSLAQAYPELPLTAVMGGLRAGEQRPVTADVRDTVLHHWQQVAEASGQPFRFDGALPDGFVYDTEPACRAVVSVRRLDPAQERAALAAVQRAFYAEGRDVTDTGTLVAIAGELGLDEPAFRDVFQAAETRTATVAAFVFGSVMLLDTDVPGYGINVGVIAGMAISAIGLTALTVVLFWRSRRAGVVTGDSVLVGQQVRVGDDGWAELNGEQWQVRSSAALSPGQRARVVGVDGLKLRVEPMDEEE